MPTLFNDGTIADAIKAVLDADAGLSALDGFKCEVEPQNWKGVKPFVGIYFTGWTYKQPPLAMGQVEDAVMNFELVCMRKWMGNLDKGREARSELFGNVLNALMGNRTLNDNCRACYPTGGDADLRRQGNAFLIAGVIRLAVEVQQTTF